MFFVGASRQRRFGIPGARALSRTALWLVAGGAALAAPTMARAQTVGEQSVGLPATTTTPSTATTPSEEPVAPGTTAPTTPAAAAPQVVAPSPVVTPVAQEKAPTPTSAKVTAKPVDTEPLLTEDELTVSGYMPGYRRYEAFSPSPHVPMNDAFAGGITPAFGMPNRADDWTFRFSGSMNISLQASSYQRRRLADGQNETAFHTPPQTIEEWASFTSTSSVPGNWVGLNFAYGNSKVTAHTSIDTWNPTAPTTYYQLGTQYFINNAYLAYTPIPVGDFRFQINAGFFATSYGLLSRYGGGVYVNPIAGLIRGVGETSRLEFDLSKDAVASVEHGIMTPRNGRIPDGIISSPINGYNRTTWPAAWIHHAHAGLLLKGDTQYQFQLHYLHNWSQDERVQMAVDNPVTRQLDETNIPDGRISVYAADIRAINDTYGYLSAGVAYLRMKHAFPLKGLMTYGGDGENLADRWLGLPADGTGKMLVTAINYTVSLGKIVAHPTPFNGDGPDIVINTGFHWATTWSDYEAWNRRDRYKGAIDGLYTLIRYLGVGCRFDAVVPNSKDMDETFYVLAPRIQLKTNWTSREAINLMYARWFYGSRTRNEGTGERTPERLDNQLFALNFNLWW
jgi:hypothetical protein